MYDIALTVAACLKAGTRADVAWLLETEGLPVADWADAVVFTPGGGRTGSLGGVTDKLAENAGRMSNGRVVDVEISEVDALIAELPTTGRARCLMTPADRLPTELWKLAAARQRFCLVIEVDGDEVTDAAVYSAETIQDADDDIQTAWASQPSGSTVTEGRIVSIFVAVPQLVVVGGGPIAEALVGVAGEVGWQAKIAGQADLATGLIAPLSAHDNVVIAAHDLDLAGAGLSAALDSKCGYIGSVGSRKMQADRSDWLAYRGITDLTRVHGPAGLDIGAKTPGEVAVAIVAEAIAKGRQS